MKKCRVTLEEFEAKYLMEGSQVLLVCDGDVREYEVLYFPEKYLTRKVLFISASDKGKVMIFLKSAKREEW
ncbi:hypothetical protein [Sporofaciens musculi]|uniref:hypothetical protein n=1 Tax=Sporofaciens musculi TaxID=2681861 RepID=UPI0025A0DE51|nr:hypothetical protein [Sporofaciens musculi]